MVGSLTATRSRSLSDLATRIGPVEVHAKVDGRPGTETGFGGAPGAGFCHAGGGKRRLRGRPETRRERRTQQECSDGFSDNDDGDGAIPAGPHALGPVVETRDRFGDVGVYELHEAGKLRGARRG
jgi:hypothetical protein